MLTLWRITERLTAIIVGLTLCYTSIRSEPINWIGLGGGLLLVSLGVQIIHGRGLSKELGLGHINDILPLDYQEHEKVLLVVNREVAQLRHLAILARGEQRRALIHQLDESVRRRAVVHATKAASDVLRSADNDPISLRIKWGLTY